jgi:cation diffusion facilitator family transporter
VSASFDADEIALQKTRVTYVGAAVNVFLTIIKIGVGVLGQSTALIADGIHSLSDLLSDLFVIIAIKLGSREADYLHPYGHRRFETIATVLLGMGLVVIAGGIIWDGMERMQHPETLLMPSHDTMAIALISILANEWLYQYTRRVGMETRSKLLMANAWHHRSDAVSSVVVLFGIAAVIMGYPFADAVAAIIVALMIAKIGAGLVAESIHELVDTALPEHRVKEIRRAIKTTDGVQGIHLLRTRQMGEDAYVDAHIVVDPRITVSEGHMIGDIVRDKLKTGFDEVVDVLVHVDPEDDEFKDNYEVLLTRREIQSYLEEYLGDFWSNIDEFRIHYLDGQLELEVMLPPVMVTQPHQVEKIKQHCALLEKKIDQIARVFVFFKA